MSKKEKIPQPEILFEDNHLAVLSKPAGLLSQGESSGTPNMVDWLRAHFGRNYVGLVHRLDRNTSGLMVVAKRTKAAARLSRSLQEGDLQRTYQAWLHGKISGKFCWHHWLAKDPKKNQVTAFRREREGAKEAILHGRALRSIVAGEGPLTLAEFRLETGRSHQIRVQAAAEGHPLAGDPKYGRKKASSKLTRQALHSARLCFPHPMSGELLTFKSALPADMKF